MNVFKYSSCIFYLVITNKIYLHDVLSITFQSCIWYLNTRNVFNAQLYRTQYQRVAEHNINELPNTISTSCRTQYHNSIHEHSRHTFSNFENETIVKGIVVKNLILFHIINYLY